MVEQTMIEGELFFERSRDLLRRQEFARERERLEGLESNKPPGSGAPSTQPRIPRERGDERLDDAEDGGNN
jgi:hypothetical protein